MKSIFKTIVVTILTWEARAVLCRYKPKIVAVTGSVGKTSTKDAIFTLFRHFYHARKSEKSFNSEIGVPLTILGLPNGWRNPLIWLSNIFKGFFLCFPIPYTLNAKPFPEWLVLEVGADRPGDIRRIAKWLPITVAVITRVGSMPVHIEFFPSVKDLIDEKASIASSLVSGGALVLNNDDDNVRIFENTARSRRIITVGVLPGGDITGSHYEIFYDAVVGRKIPAGIAFKVNYRGNSVPVRLRGVLGRQHVYPTLAALAVGVSQDLNLVSMVEALTPHAHETAPGRMKLLLGVKNTTIIDDSYNSSPLALEEALVTLGDINVQDDSEARPRSRKIAVLGDMLELGKYSHDAHIRAGEKVFGNADILVTVGVRGREIAEGAQRAGMNESKIFQFDNSVEAGKELEQMIQAGDTILVKGSQGIRMEKIVEEIMAHPEDKEKLLVRQEPEWSKC